MATKKKTEAQIISEAMGLLGRRKTEKKRAAVARNNVATRFQAKPLEELQCVCGQCPDHPKTYCPRGRAIVRRQRKASEQTKESQANQARAEAQGSGSMTNTIEYSKVETNGTTKGDTNVRDSLSSALALREELAATIQAGTIGTDAPSDAAVELDTMRAERFTDAD